MIHIRNLQKSFGEKHVLRGINLDIPAGKITVVIGGSGSGKSVFLKHLLGLIKPDSGSITVDGIELTGLRGRELVEFRKRFGMLFQEAALFDSLSVAENIAFPMVEHTPWNVAERKRRVREKLDMVGLGEIEHQFPAELSGGMRKRVGLARAIAIDPKIILYDEPTTGLDPIMSHQVNALIRETNDRLGLTSVVISHDIRGALRIADQLVMLHFGAILQAGTPAEILASENETIQEFLRYDVRGDHEV
ncbi:ABC transporter ATP-binding protein [Chrysiogenes arsenatis]|uniref:ABC transporter ATP-binding protein n=1 Tax=Chrysiogenes arsenatis TaxID=309797 RepID=UPI000411196D|nr:ABC transporter ATP-binding protein [Chrysiogenes arsenatis]